VKHTTHTVPTVRLDNRERSNVINSAFYDSAKVTIQDTRSTHRHGSSQALIRRAHKIPTLFINSTDEKGLVEIRVEAVCSKYRNIKIDDVSILQWTGVRDAMADNFIDWHAKALWKPVVIERRGVHATLNASSKHGLVNLLPGHSRTNHGAANIKDLTADPVSSRRALI
jgi:hypothetical protein